jgi:hypothetical protein
LYTSGQTPLVHIAGILQNLPRNVGSRALSIPSPGRPRTLTKENDTHVIRLDEENLGSRKEDAECDWDQKASEQIELEKEDIIIMPQNERIVES